MRILCDIHFDFDSPAIGELRELGLAPELGVVQVAEHHPVWPEVRHLAEEYDGMLIHHTEFSKPECEEAPLLQMDGKWQHQYPQPEHAFYSDGGYMTYTYDLSAFCTSCGTGARQEAPFRMLREPRWGTRHVFTLFWEDDKFFVRPEVWKAVFNPSGVDCIAVLRHSTGKELETVVQLDIPILDHEVLVLDEGHQRERCEKCGRTKLADVRRGPMPPVSSVPGGLHAFRTKEYFGADRGLEAPHLVLTSPELYAEIERCNLKGARFIPAAAVGDKKWPCAPDRDTMY